jgi:elongation factor P
LPLEEVAYGYRTMQYLYSQAGHAFFMDSQSFDEVELPASALGGFGPLLHEGDEYRVLFAGDKPLRLDTPDSVTLQVTDTAAPTHAVGASSNILKEATLEHDLHTRVPLFIRAADLVRINTASYQYLGKA